MMSYTKSAIQVAEKYVTNCTEFSILNTLEKFDETLTARYGREYDVVVRIYSGESDKLTEIIQQDLFEHFQKKLPEKLKNNHRPITQSLDNQSEMTIFIVGRS